MENKSLRSYGDLKKVAFIGTFLPRRCGIATFTADLCDSVAKALPDSQCFVVAMNDIPEGYAYPDRVRFEIQAARRAEYDRAAEFLNVNQVDVVSVQHEYGIFGGPAGSHVLPMLRQVRAPIVTTLHTVLTEPQAEQRRVMKELCDCSDRLVVMSPRAVGYLQEIYNVPESKIRMIHHGIPDMPFVDPNFYKDQFGAEGRPLILTFGLLSPGKGIEYAIEAMKGVAASFPNVLYIVLGATHPHIRRESGEAYRTSLETMVRERGLEENVRFVNRFVALHELCEYLGAADLYVTPYLNANQIVSGTLAYAMGTGKAVISTPYWYAEDMLADDRGRLVPFRDPDALKSAIIDLLSNDTQRHAMRKQAYQYCRGMIWEQVGRDYAEVFAEVREERKIRPRPIRGVARGEEQAHGLPEFNARHLLKMTDDFGIFQHAQFSVPNPRHGYSTDDQARALMVAVKAQSLYPEVADWELLESRYLTFLQYAWVPEKKRFLNFFNLARQPLEQPWSDDVHARALLGLGATVAFTHNEGHRRMAADLMEQSLSTALGFTSPRAWSLTILAIQMFLRVYSGASAYRKEREILAQRLLDQLKGNAGEGWVWLEDIVAYANGHIPHALIEAGQWIPNAEMVDWGLRSLDWLVQIQTSERGYFVPIGNEGWYPRQGTKARFDQQPLEAQVMLEAALAALRATRDRKWAAVAQRCFDWFLGANDLGIPVYDPATGGCYDGLHADRLNQNQGAESTLAWLLSLIAMNEVQDQVDEIAGGERHD